MKHVQSRRPSSWKEEKITRSKEDALEILKSQLKSIILNCHMNECFSTEFREKLESKMEKFAELASKESDCSSAHKGGDLGVFGQGQMQSRFIFCEKTSIFLTV